MAELTAARARQLLRYNPETGNLHWRVNASNRVKPGDVAGYRHQKRDARNAYWSLSVDGVKYHAHRIAWLITYGAWPVQQIDHINGDGTDNRLCNLRLATIAQQQHNTCKSRRNTTGFKGVTLVKGSGKYQACITHNGTTTYLGQFDRAEDAHTAYCAAADKYHGEFANYGEFK